MRLLLVLAYLVIEIGAFVAITQFLGFGWAVLITLGAAVLGFVLLQRRGRRLLDDLRRASRNEVDARAPLTDTALLAASTVLMVLPGVVSTLAGLILLAAPVRRTLRPVIAAAGARHLITTLDRAGVRGRGVYQRGTVVDGSVVNPDGTVSTAHGAAQSGDVMEGTIVHGDRTLPRGH